MRPSKDEYYLNICEVVLTRSTCLRRKYGAVIVKDDQIISTGYNGSPRDNYNCCDKGVCRRDELGCPKGTGYEHCPAVHAEQNALLSVDRLHCIGADIYIVGLENDGTYAVPYPCHLCQGFIQQMGIRNCIMRPQGHHKLAPMVLKFDRSQDDINNESTIL